MILTETSLIYKGIRPLQKLGASAREAITAPLAGLAMPQRVPDHLRVVPPDPWAGDAQRGRDMISGVFRLAGQTIAREDLSWEPAMAKPEWIAELHGFEWLRDLRSVGGDRARRMARDMVANWIDRYQQKPDGISCRPDVAGLRLSSWISFHDFFCASADDGFRHAYFASIQRQARHLQRSLPAGLQGIALLRAIKGLAYSGLALEDGAERLDHAFVQLQKQMREQILADGGHVSRSPQATFECLQILVDLRTAIIAAKLSLPEDLQHAIDRIAPAVKFFRHGDGALSHFNGGQEMNAGIIEATLMHSGARGKAMQNLPHAGYEKIQLGRSSLIVDVGAPLVSRYSDRAHAGALSFEYSFGRDRVIVNCGSTPVKGKLRELLRGTAAHSALVIDNRNVVAVDDKGYLGAAPEIRHKRAEREGIAAIEASHNGYVPRFGQTHRRTLRLHDGGETLSGEDQLLGKAGAPFAVRFHLHPGIQASLIQDGAEVLLRARSGTGWRFSLEGAAKVELAVEDSLYGCEGEAPRKTQQIVLSGVTESAATLVSWRLSREKL